MIRLEKIQKRYGDVVAVENVSLSIQGGELVVLLGSSGSGKTTTLRMINRLTEPSGGSVYLDDRSTQEISPTELRRRIGYVSQGGGLFPHLTVGDNIAVTPQLLGWAASEIEQRVDELLTLIELPTDLYRDRMPSELSGGEQQRVALARALAARPRVMLLDEPFGALDPLTRDRMRQFFLRFRSATGLTAIFVTHDMVEALVLGDRIAVMHQGRLVQIGTPHELLTQPTDEYVDQLMRTPRNEAKVIDRLLHQEGDR